MSCASSLFFRIKEGPLNAKHKENPSLPDLPLLYLSSILVSILVSVQSMPKMPELEYLSASPEGCTLNNLSSVSKLRLLSQLIPLHPKVKHWSNLLLPWFAFCRTNDGPLTTLPLITDQTRSGHLPMLSPETSSCSSPQDLAQVDTLVCLLGSSLRMGGSLDDCLPRKTAHR